MNMFSKLAITAGMSLLLAAGVAQAQSKTFNVWWYELPDTAQAKAWTQALGELKAKHPDININFEQKTFEQLQKAGSLILNSDQAPDVLEYNKGNATAGLVASQGLLTPLDDEFKSRGWDKILNETNTQLSKYDENGIYGSGPMIGIPAYAEFVSVFYNIDMFNANGVKVPTTFEEFVAALDTFKKKGITPLAYGTVDSNAQHLLYTLALTQGRRHLGQELPGPQGSARHQALPVCRPDDRRLGQQGLHLQGLDRPQGHRRCRQPVLLRHVADVCQRYLE